LRIYVVDFCYLADLPALAGIRTTRKLRNWARTRARHVSRPQEVVRIDSRLPQYSAGRPFRHVAWMISARLYNDSFGD
jgi:hypothetical protein